MICQYMLLAVCEVTCRFGAHTFILIFRLFDFAFKMAMKWVYDILVNITDFSRGTDSNSSTWPYYMTL